jgi:tetratricopeptide (TPR) repeat protein
VILPLVAMLAAAEPVAIHPDELNYRSCAALVKTDPQRAADRATEWRQHGGGLYARQCQGQAYVALERWQPAAVAFEQAAHEAQAKKDPRAADFLVQSGNAWLAMNDGARARAAFDAALASAGLTNALRGEVHLDRARANVALSDLAAARADIDKGLELVPADPFAWYLSAALALREEALPRAQEDIAKAISLSPDDPDVLLFAGNLAGMTGESAAAETFYERAIRVAPNSPAGKAAQAALAANGAGGAATQPPPAPQAKP